MIKNRIKIWSFCLLTVFTISVFSACNSHGTNSGNGSFSAEPSSVAESGEENSSTSHEEETEMGLSEFKLIKEEFEGKRVVVYGDSISAKATLSAGENDYVEMLGASLGFTYERFAVSGSLISYVAAVENDRQSGSKIVLAHEESNQKADYAIIFYGTNDFARNVPLGSATDCPERVSDVKTYCGGFNFLVGNLRKNNSDLKILILTPMKRFDRSMFNANGDYLKDFAETAEKMGEVLECRVINLFSLFDESNFQKNSVNTSDGLHPSQEGHKVLAEYLLKLDQ